MTETTPTAAQTDTATMRAVQDRYGSSEVLRLAEVARPVIGDGQVLVRVHAAGLDRGTEHLMTGKPYAMRLGFGIRRPKNPVPGRDVAGTVVQVGSSVRRFSPGDEVYGVAPGSFAEYAVAREDKLAVKPANLSFVEAAVVPISAGTALQALTDVADMQAGQSVLVLGASGGVGSYAVQLAHAFGADVTGVCSIAKLDYVASLGADYVIDYTGQDWADGTHRYDVILNIAGNPPMTRLRRALTPRGTVVFVGGEGGGTLTGMSRQLRGALLVSPVVRQKFALFLARNAPPTTSGSPTSSRPERLPPPRPHLPTRPDSRSDAAARARSGSRQGRHHPVTCSSPSCLLAHRDRPHPRTQCPSLSQAPDHKAPRHRTTTRTTKNATSSNPRVAGWSCTDFVRHRIRSGAGFEPLSSGEFRTRRRLLPDVWGQSRIALLTRTNDFCSHAHLAW